MKVSVCMVTYNQERFVAQAVASALSQETDFEYEIVIGEDCSTDRTRDILVKLQQANPDKIRLLLHEHNLGGQQNFVRTLDACQGQYIAYLEGDDYWTSSDKLQKQANFLDQHPDFMICFHNVRKFYDDGSASPELICPDDQPAVSTIEDILRKNFIPACSVMFRSHLFGAFPDWFFELKLGDWLLHILNAQYGKIGYINEEMAAYRMHGAAAWSTLTPDRIIAYAGEMLRHVDAHFDCKYHQIIELAIGDLYSHWAWHITTSQVSAEEAQAILDLASRLDPRAQARLLAAIAARGAAIEQARMYYAQQAHKWQTAAQEHSAWIQQLEQARDHYVHQTHKWQTVAQEHSAWIQQLEQARDHYVQQAHNWQAETERLVQIVAPLQNKLAQLQEAHDQLVEQIRLREERRLSHRLRRVGTRIQQRMKH